MSDGEVVFDKRIQANITSDLKERVRELMLTKDFDSEAEVVRTALWQFVEAQTETEKPPEAASPVVSQPAPPALETQANALLHQDLKERMDLVAWLLTLVLVMVATVSSKLLNAVCREQVDRLHLLDQTVNLTVHEQAAVRQKLALGWRAFNHAGRVAHVLKGANQPGSDSMRP